MKRVTMKQASKSLRLLILLCFAIGQSFCLGFGPPRLAAHDFDPHSLWPQQVQQLSHLSPPGMQAKAALLIDVATQTVLYEKDAGQRLPMASTTKMMTALVALERGKLSDPVTVQADDLAETSAVGLTAGEVWTLEDLLYALLLPSDNAAALVIARHIAGSPAAFVDMMNTQAAGWGLKDTHFVNPHGLDDPAHYSTAQDLAQIALHGLANPTFAAIVSTPERRVGTRTFQNLNQLLGTYEGTAGIKTGTTLAAGQCLVSLVGRPDGRTLCVILGSDDRYRDSRLLLDYYFANYCLVVLSLGPKGLNRLRQPDGKDGILVLQEHPQVLLARWQQPWLHAQPLGGDVAAGSPAGTVRFTLGPTLLKELPLYLSAP